MKPIRFILIPPLLLIAFLLLMLGFFEGRKAYWDYRVQEMCKKDGGTKVFEYVTISRDDALKQGLMRGNLFVIPTSKKDNSNFYIKNSTQEIHKVEPRILRFETKIIRIKDDKVIAKRVLYGRIGGDFPTFSHPTYQTCFNEKKALMDFRSAVQLEGD